MIGNQISMIHLKNFESLNEKRLYINQDNKVGVGFFDRYLDTRPGPRIQKEEKGNRHTEENAVLK